MTPAEITLCIFIAVCIAANVFMAWAIVELTNAVYACRDELAQENKYRDLMKNRNPITHTGEKP